MNRIRTITLAAALAAGLGGQAIAAGAAPAPQGATAMAGQLLMSQLAGGLADGFDVLHDRIARRHRRHRAHREAAHHSPGPDASDPPHRSADPVEPVKRREARDRLAF